MEHQSEFLARDIDLLITGSFNLEHRGSIELHPVFEETYICVFPKDYRGPADILGTTLPFPLIRFSRLTGTGQHIERQIVRMKMKQPQAIEVESSHQQLALVAAGLGWTITTPLCLAAVPELHGDLRPEPMTRGRFSRQAQVVARAGELGDIPRLTASVCQATLRGGVFAQTIDRFPWIEQQLAWPEPPGA
jgi:DNA-binding transcriptional LysR family regulator